MGEIQVIMASSNVSVIPVKHTLTSTKIIWGSIYFLIFIMDGILIWNASQTLILGVDWQNCFRPAALSLLVGKSPFETTGCFLSGPWGLIPFIPFALLPGLLGWILIIICAYGSFIYVAHRLGAKPWVISAFLLSPPVIYELTVTNTSWLAAWGLILPPQIGLFFVLIKPQLGLLVAFFWLIEAWRTGGLIQIVKTFAPITIVFLITILLYGFWPLRSISVLSSDWNVSMFPLSIPIGLVLFYHSLKTRNIRWAIVATPFISPYIGLHAFSFACLGLISLPVESIITSLSLWFFIIFRGGWHGL